MWTEVYERNVRDVLILQRDLAQAIAGAVQVELTPADEQRLSTTRAVDPEAYEFYLRGQHFRSREYESIEDKGRAVGYFKKSIEKDSTFAPAHAAWVIASLVRTGEDESKLRDAAQTALALDPSLADAYVAHGLIAMLVDGNWIEAEQRFQQAVALNPSSVEARYESGLLYLRTGRFDNARTHFEVALQLDPLSALTQLAMVRYFYFTEQYDAALEQIEQVLELDPDHVMTHVEWLPLIHAARGDRAAVLQAIKRGENIGDYRENVSKRMMTAAMAGERALARSYIEKSRQHVREHPEDLRLFWYSAGVTEAHLGNLDAAYAYLERTLEAPNYLVPRLLYSPLFAPVRADPRFEAFRASMGMPAPNTESARSLNRPS